MVQIGTVETRVLFVETQYVIDGTCGVLKDRILDGLLASPNDVLAVTDGDMIEIPHSVPVGTRPQRRECLGKAVRLAMFAPS